MTDDTLRAILSRVITEPGEDVHRLVFADALDERDELGDAQQAEFIRVQIDVSRVAGLCDMPEHALEHGSVDPADVSDPVQVAAAAACNAEMKRVLALKRRARELLPLFHRDGLRNSAHWKRGFLARLVLTASKFLQLADTLLWHPKQTVECTMCEGERMFRHTPDRHCRTCSGTGLIPRPCPLTAHPIRKVTLVTVPLSSGRSDGVPLPLSWFQQRWPDVEFDLPKPNQNAPYDDLFPNIPWGGGL